MPVRVLVADNSAIIQQTICELLEAADVSVVGRAGDGDEAVRLAGDTAPDVVILDCAMPRMNGIDAGRAILRTRPGLPIILLTMSATEYLIAAAFNAGIRGYVAKADAADDLLRAIEAVRRGATFVSPSASRVLYEHYLPKTELK